MLAKLRLESGEFCFWKKLILQSLLSVMAAYVHLDSFRMDWPGASVGEFIVYSLTQENYFLVLFPFLCLAWTVGKSQEICRYPLLLRYRTRNEFFLIRFLAKAFFAMAVLLEHIGILLLMGHSLPIAPQRLFLSSGHPAGIILMQFLNLFCYVCVMILLYELSLHAAGNAILGVILTASVSLLNLLAVKLALKTVIMWTPWGNIAYRLFEQERPGYRFYGTYWIFLLLLLFFLADEWNGRKDYVFEETRKTE